MVTKLKQRLMNTRISVSDVVIFLLFCGLLFALFHYRTQIEVPISFHTSLNNVYQAKLGADDNLYVLDEEHRRILKATKKGKEIYEIKENTYDADTFTYVNDYQADKAGNLYVTESRWQDMHLDREAILMYDAKGNYSKTIVNYEYNQNVYVNKHKIMGLSITGNNLHYAILQDDMVDFHTLNLDTGEDCIQSVQVEHAFDAVADIIFTSDADTAYILCKQGVIYEVKEEQKEMIYDITRDSENRNGIPYRIAITNTGDISYLDIKNRKIFEVVGTMNTSVCTIQDTDSITIASNEIENGTGYILCDDNCILFFENGIERNSLSELDRSSKSICFKSTLLVGLAMAFIIFVYVVLRLFFIFRKVKLSETTRIELAVVAVVMLIASVVSIRLLNEFQKLYRERIEDEIEIAAYTVANELSFVDLKDLDQADGFLSPSYEKVIEIMEKDLDTRLDFYQKIYCNILQYDGDSNRGYAVAYKDQSIGTFYPLDETETKEVKEVYDTRKEVWNQGKADSSGSYLYIKIPIIGENNEVTGVVAVGTENYIISQILSEILTSNLFTLALIILIIWLVLGEIIPYMTGKNEYVRKVQASSEVLPLHMIRILVFLIFAAYNMTASFLPVYALHHTSQAFGLSKAFVASIPITINLFFIGVMSLLCAGIMKKVGFQKMFLLSCILSLSGNLLIFVNSSFTCILVGLLLDGIGVGMITNSVYIFIATIADEDSRMEGFSIYNGGCLAGINFGMIVGAALSTMLSRHKVFLVVAVLWGIIAVLLFQISPQLLVFLRKKQESGEITERSSMGSFLSKKSIMSFFVLIQNPYIVINSFVFYFVPIFCDSHGYNDAVISLLFMLYSLFAMYMGSGITKFLYQKYRKNSIYIGCIMSFMAIMVFAILQNLVGIVAALIILGVSNSFGKSVQQTFFIQQEAVNKYGEDKAMGIYNFSENIGESAGPMIFSKLMVATGMLRNLSLFCTALTAAMLAHLILNKGGDRIEETKVKK